METHCIVYSNSDRSEEEVKPEVEPEVEYKKAEVSKRFENEVNQTKYCENDTYIIGDNSIEHVPSEHSMDDRSRHESLKM